jgi:uncharacterized phage protein (TIGR02216 family)
MIPWRKWFAFAIATLGLSPEAFWGLTIAEWRWLAPEEGAALDRAGLEALLALYPDDADRNNAMRNAT